MLRLLLDAILDGILGFEREQKGRAAGIWLTAAIGVAAGMGGEATAVLSALLALVILYTVPKVARLESRGSQLGRGDIR